MSENEASNHVPLPALREAGPAAPNAPRNAWSASGLSLPTPFPLPEPGREVAFVLKASDASAVQQASLRSIKVWPWLALCLLVFVGRIVLFGQQQAARDFFLKFLLPALPAGILVTVFYLFLLRAAKKKTEKQLEEAGLQIVRLTPDYVYLLDNENESKTRWRRVAAVQDTPTHLVIRFINGNYMPIPKNAFASEAEAKGFYDEAIALWHAAGGSAN